MAGEDGTEIRRVSRLEAGGEPVIALEDFVRSVVPFSAPLGTVA